MAGLTGKKLDVSLPKMWPTLMQNRTATTLLKESYTISRWEGEKYIKKKNGSKQPSKD